MPISVQCPSCGKKLTAKDELAGKKATCPGCKRLLVIPAARPLSQPKLPVPAATTYRAAYPRRKKRDLLLWYIGGGVALCLAIVLVVIISISGGDRGIARNTEPALQADTTPKPETMPAPKPTESNREPEPQIIKTDTTANPELKPVPPELPKPEVERGQSAKPFELEKSPDKADKPDKATPKMADAPKEPPADRQSIEQVENLLKELGFTLIAVFGDSPDMHVPAPDGKDYEFNAWTCENKAAGATLTLTRNMALDGAAHVPGPRYELRASHTEKDRIALMELCEKISMSLKRTAEECVTQFDRTKKPAERSVGKIKVYVDRTGAYIESIPAVIPGFHFGAVGREAGGLTD